MALVLVLSLTTIAALFPSTQLAWVAGGWLWRLVRFALIKFTVNNIRDDVLAPPPPTGGTVTDQPLLENCKNFNWVAATIIAILSLLVTQNASVQHLTGYASTALSVKLSAAFLSRLPSFACLARNSRDFFGL